MCAANLDLYSLCLLQLRFQNLSQNPYKLDSRYHSLIHLFADRHEAIMRHIFKRLDQRLPTLSEQQTVSLDPRRDTREFPTL